MTTSPGNPGPTDDEDPRVPLREDGGDPVDVDPEMMQGGDAGRLRPGPGRGHGRDDEDDEDESARRNIGG